MRQEAPEPWATAMRDAGMVDRGRPSMRQLAQRAGLAVETVRRLVYGTAVSDHETVVAVARALRVDVRTASQWAGQSRTVKAPWTPPAEADLLTDRQRRALEELIRSMTEGSGSRGDTAPTKKQVRIVDELDENGEGTVYAVLEDVDPEEPPPPPVTPSRGAGRPGQQGR